MSDPRTQPATVRPTAGHWAGAAISIVLLVLVDWFVVVPMGVFAAMASDSCGEHDSALICTVPGQWVTALAPFAGALIGLVLAVIGALRPRHRAAYGALAWMAAPIGVVISALIAATNH